MLLLMHLEIRLGIVSWHVLGEELSSTGTSRFVDSSLERLQVKVSGLLTVIYYYAKAVES
jgi:uncharacterized protein (DUF2126 family)